MMWDGPWSISNLARYAPDLDYGVAPLPAGPGGYRGARMGGFGLAIASGSSNADEAWEFAKWLTVDADNNREFAYVTGNIPANIEAANNPVFTGHPHFSGIVENMQFAQIRPPVVGYASMEGDALIPSLQLFMSGELSAEQALNEAQLRGDIILADNR
jgi:multiple sugar transport system substrate-binding protein